GRVDGDLLPGGIRDDAGEALALFRLLVDPLLDLVDLRLGLPLDLDDAGGGGVVPEQGPVEVLFGLGGFEGDAGYLDGALTDRVAGDEEQGNMDYVPVPSHRPAPPAVLGEDAVAVPRDS